MQCVKENHTILPGTKNTTVYVLADCEGRKEHLVTYDFEVKVNLRKMRSYNDEPSHARCKEGRQGTQGIRPGGQGTRGEAESHSGSFRHSAMMGRWACHGQDVRPQNATQTEDTRLVSLKH